MSGSTIKKITALLLSLMMLIGMLPMSAIAATISAPADGNCTILWTTDPQWYSFAYNDIITHQNQWVVDNYNRMDMRYIIHTGDFVDNPHSHEQWAVMDAAYKKWDDAGLAYGILAGNHDVDGSDHTEFSQYFGKSRYESKPWYGGQYEDNFGHYDLMTIDGADFMFVYMGYNSTYKQADYDWMNSVLAAHPNRIAVLGFHDYLQANGERSPNGELWFQNVVLRNPNVRMVCCGHNYNSTRKVQEIDDNGDGKADRTLYQMMANYQSTTKGGNGFMRFMECDVAGGKIISRTYSPYIEEFGSDYEDGTVFDEYGYRDEFVIPFDFSAPTVRADGTNGTVVVTPQITFGITENTDPVTMSLVYQNVAETGATYRGVGVYDRFFSLNAADAFSSPRSLDYVIAEYNSSSGYSITGVVRGSWLDANDPFVKIPQNGVVITLPSGVKDIYGATVNVDAIAGGQKAFLNRAGGITTPTTFKNITLTFSGWDGKYSVDGKNRLTGNGEWVIYDRLLGDSTADAGYAHTWDMLFAFTPVSGTTYKITAVDTRSGVDKDLAIPANGFVLATNTYWGGKILRESIIERLTVGATAVLAEDAAQADKSLLPSSAAGWTYDSALIGTADENGAQVLYKVSGDWPDADYNLASSITVNPASFALNYDYCIETNGKANVMLFFKNSNATSYVSSEWVSIQSNFAGANISANSGDVKGDDVRRSGKVNLSNMNIPATCYNDDGTLTINAIRIKVSGAVDKKISLYDLSITSDVRDSDVSQSLPLMDAESMAIVDDGRKGSVTYDNGTLLVEADTANGFEVVFNPGDEFNVSLIKNWLMNLSATTRFDIQLDVTTAGGDRTFGLVSDFNPALCTALDGGLIPAGQYVKSFDLSGCYIFNEVMPADGITTVKKVRVMLGGAGQLRINALQMSNGSAAGYFADGVTKTLSSKAVLETATYTIDNDIVSDVAAGTTVSEFLSKLSSGYTVSVTDNGVAVSGNALVKTGQTVVVENGAQTLASYEISVVGDYDRNGELASADARALLKKMLELNPAFTTLEYKTVDLNEDGAINTSDVRVILRMLVTQ